MPTEKVIEIGSLGELKLNAENSNMRFFNAIVEGVKQKVLDDTGISLGTPGDQKLGKGTKSITLTGRKIVVDEEEYKDIETKVRQTMDNLKNPSNLLGTIK